MIQRSSGNIGLAALDGLVALIITVSAIIYSNYSLAGFHNITSRPISVFNAAFGLSFIVLWQYCFSVLNLYDRFATIPSRMAAILKGVLIMTFSVMVHLALFHPTLLRGRTVIWTVVTLFAYEVDRVGFRDMVVNWIAARNPKHVLIIGTGRRASKAWREIRTRYHSSTKVVGFVDDRHPAEMAPDVADRYLGRLNDLDTLLLKHTVDTLIIAMPIQSCYAEMQQAVTVAEGVGVDVIYLQDIYATKIKREEPNRAIFQDLFPRHEQYAMRLAVKRFVDIVLSAFGLILLAPLFLCVSLAVKLTSRGPAFFRQDRFGYRRRLFPMYKFRSMVADAEDRMAALEASNEAVGPIFKMKNDPRITPLGKLLRSTSIDELPQLWSVLIGDMSLVGPRPMSIRDVSLFNEATLMKRFSVKPGITGLWQVNGRSQLDFDEWVELDGRYIEQWSLSLDMKILTQTVGAVLKRSGAV